MQEGFLKEDLCLKDKPCLSGLDTPLYLIEQIAALPFPNSTIIVHLVPIRR